MGVGSYLVLLLVVLLVVDARKGVTCCGYGDIFVRRRLILDYDVDMKFATVGRNVRGKNVRCSAVTRMLKGSTSARNKLCKTSAKGVRQVWKHSFMASS